MDDIAGTEQFNKAYTGPRPDILSLLPKGVRSVLDVGCSDGTLGASIKAHWPSIRVVGMESSSAMGAVAQLRLDRVLVGDIEHENALDGVTDERFDLIICALEHLRDPWTMLRNIKPLLAQNARVICSIPNVRHIDTVYNLVFKGVWPCRDRGIHDCTHLRFFTKKSVLELFAKECMSIEPH